MNRNVFFYRDNDKLSNHIYLIMKHNNLINYFDCVNVDTARIHIRLMSVPALLIYELKQILYGENIFKFLNNIIQQNNIKDQQFKQLQQERQRYINQTQQSITKNTNNTQTNTQTNIQNNIQEQNIKYTQPQNNIIGFIQQEMSGFSDNYTFSSPNINISPQHNFINSNENIKIYTGDDVKKITNNQTPYMINKLKEIRNTENKEIQQYQLNSRNNKKNQEDIKNLNAKIEAFIKKKQLDDIK